MTRKNPKSFRRIPNTLRDSREIIARLLREGWVEQPKNASSHRVFKKAGIHESMVVPHPKKDFGTGILNAFYKRAGWK